MWKRSFVATTVALGGSVDDALAAISGSNGLGTTGPDLGASATDLVAQLRAPQRAARATALAKVVRDVVLAIDEGTLR
jgi:hypothetical protein